MRWSQCGAAGEDEAESPRSSGGGAGRRPAEQRGGCGSFPDDATRVLFYFELVSFSIFAVEYVLRVWSCTADPAYAHPVFGRARFVFRPLMLADATAVLTFFVFMLLPTGLDLGALRTLRLLSRLASLARYSAGMQAVAAVASARKSELLAVASVVCALLVLASSLMYIVEHTAQPDKFSSIPAAMWWGIVTVTTVGYGDVAPVTPMGRLLAGVIALLSIGIFALPAGILGAGFLDHLNQRRSHETSTCPNCGVKIAGVSPASHQPVFAAAPYSNGNGNGNGHSQPGRPLTRGGRRHYRRRSLRARANGHS